MESLGWGWLKIAVQMDSSTGWTRMHRLSQKIIKFSNISRFAHFHLEKTWLEQKKSIKHYQKEENRSDLCFHEQDSG